MANFQEIKARAQQGNTGAIAALLNYTLKRSNLQAKVTATGSCLAVHLHGQQAPDSNLMPRLKKSLDQLAIKRFEHLEVSAYQVGQTEVVWTSRAPLTPIAASAALPVTSSSSSSAVQQRFSFLGKELPENPWLKQIAGLIAVPLLIINSIQFMLLTQTQLFGLLKIGNNGWSNPQTNEQISNIWLYFGRGYLWYSSLVLLGVFATRYAFHPRSQRANWVALSFATLPTILWLAAILTDPLLHFSASDIYSRFSSAPAKFLHPTMGQPIVTWQKWTLITFNLALLGGFIGLWMRQLFRTSYQSGTDERPTERPQGKQQRRATQVLAIATVALLIISNPSHYQHAKSRALRDLSVYNPVRPNVSREDVARYAKSLQKSTTYRSAIFFSWGIARRRRTFGILGRVYYYRLGVPSDKFPTRLDLFNPLSEFRQRPDN